MIEKGDTITISGAFMSIEASLCTENKFLVVNSRMKMPAPSTAEERAEMKANALRVENNDDGTVAMINEIPIEVKALNIIAESLKKDENGNYYFECKADE